MLLSRAKAKVFPTAKQYRGAPRPNLPIHAVIAIRTGDITRAAAALSRELTPPTFRIDISRSAFKNSEENMEDCDQEFHQYFSLECPLDIEQIYLGILIKAVSRRASFFFS